jgi:SAM-dependent methyltransferase
VANVNNRFDLPEDALADLLAFKQRVEQLGIGETVRLTERPLPHREQLTRPSLWTRFRSHIASLRRLTWTRHQVAALEDEAANLRSAVEEEANRRADLEEEVANLRSAVEEETNRRADLEEEVANLRSSVEEETNRRADLKGELSAIAPLVAGLVAAAAAAPQPLSVLDAERENAALRVQIDEVRRRLQFERLTRQRAFTDFDRRLTLTGPKATDVAPAPQSPAASLSPNVQSLLESFYFLLEDRYRGAREEIKQRLLVYRNDLRAARDRVGVAGPVIDIGCGRGELLELLAEDGFQAIGVDSNDIQLATARQHGCAVVYGDALAYLRGLKANSVLAVTGIHIVEHIPFPELIEVMQEVARVLKSGGVAIFETPNPRNLIVGATTFHLDPTHIRPLPAEVLQILLETVGFAHVEARPLHPSDTLEYMVEQHNLDRHVATLLFGPQDYAVIGAME